MLLELSRQECRWLADLVKKDKLENAQHSLDTPHYSYMLRQNYMQELEDKLEQAFQSQLNNKEYS
jgi:hypothetical protein